MIVVKQLETAAAQLDGIESDLLEQILAEADELSDEEAIRQLLVEENE